MAEIFRIGVVTVTYNSAEVLPDFLQSVAQQTLQEFILYVVDNDSKDQSVAMASSFGDPRIRVIANKENLGVAEGNNQGIRAALADGCDSVLLLNNDTTFGPKLFAELYEGLIEHNCSMATPKIFYHANPRVIWAAGGYFQAWAGYRTQHYGEKRPDGDRYSTSKAIAYAPTCCVLIHKSVFDRIGIMDPKYFVYTDDVDFMYRAMKAGLRMQYLPHSHVWHKVSSLTGGGTSLFTIRYCTRNRAYFLLKHQPKHVAEVWILIYKIYYGIRFLLHKDKRDILRLKLSSVEEARNLHALILNEK